MLTIFKTNQQLANIFLLLYLAVLRGSILLHTPTTAPKAQGILSQLLYAEFPPMTWAGFIAATVLIFIQAIFINIMMARFRVSNETTMLPGLFYCLASSFMPEFLTLSPFLLANTFLILAMLYAFDIYKNTSVATRIFDIGFWLSIASLFHFCYIVFLFWGIIALGILRGIQIKEFLMYIIGFIVPYFLFAVFLFWTDRLPLLATHFSQNIGFLNFVGDGSISTYIKIAIVMLFVVLAIFSSNSLMSRRNIASQKYVSLLFWMMLIAALSLLIQRNVGVMHLMILSVPIGILLSMLFARIGVATAEAIHMILVGVALIIQFEYLLI